MPADHEIRHYQDDHFPYSVSLSENLQFMAHWHEEIELVLVLEGQLVLGVNQREIVLRPGDIGVSASQDIHYYARQGDSRLLLLIFRPELLPQAAGWISHPQEASGPRVLRDVEAAESIRAIHGEFTSRQQDWMPAVLGHTVVLASLIGRVLFPHPAPTALPLRRQRMQKALDYLEAHFREPLTLESVASHVALSPWAFSHQFSPTVGMHFRAYLNALRVREARRLLADRSRKVVDVALECGFTSLRSFNRAFQEHAKTTPRRHGDALRRIPQQIPPSL